MLEQTYRALPQLKIEADTQGLTHSPKTMIMLHGQGDCKESYLPIFKELNLTGLHGLLLDAPFTLRDQSLSSGHFWYSPVESEQSAHVTYSSRLLTQLIDQLIGQGHDAQDLVLFGFSAGARIVLNTIQQLPYPLMAAVALSPRFVLESSAPPQSATPLFIAHGLYDDVIPFEQTHNGAQAWLAEAPGQFRSYPIGHEICYEEIRDLRQWLNETW